MDISDFPWLFFKFSEQFFSPLLKKWGRRPWKDLGRLMCCLIRELKMLGLFSKRMRQGRAFYAKGQRWHQNKEMKYTRREKNKSKMITFRAGQFRIFLPVAEQRQQLCSWRGNVKQSVHENLGKSGVWEKWDAFGKREASSLLSIYGSCSSD